MYPITEHLHFDFSPRLSYNTIGIGISPIGLPVKKSFFIQYQSNKIFFTSPFVRRTVTCFLSSDTLTDFTGFSSFK